MEISDHTKTSRARKGVWVTRKCVYYLMHCFRRTNTSWRQQQRTQLWIC